MIRMSQTIAQVSRGRDGAAAQVVVHRVVGGRKVSRTVHLRRSGKAAAWVCRQGQAYPLPPPGGGNPDRLRKARAA